MTKILFDEESGEVLRTYKDEEILIVQNLNYSNINKLNSALFLKVSPYFIKFINNRVLKKEEIYTFLSFVDMLEINQGDLLKSGGNPINIQKISKLTGKSIRTLNNHIRTLEKYKMIRRVKNGKNHYIVMNPYIVSFGNNHNTISIELFGKSQWAPEKKKNKEFKIINGGNKYERL